MTSTVRVWDLEAGQCLRQRSAGHTDIVRGVAVTADGRRIVFSRLRETGPVRVLGRGGGRNCPSPTLEGHTDKVNARVAVTARRPPRRLRLL